MSFASLLERCKAIAHEPIASLALRLVEEWSPPGGEATLAEILVEELRATGADEVYLDEEFEGSPSVICWLRGNTPGRTLQWHGHLDAIRTPHAPAVMDGDTLTGRGASDMKGALAAMVSSIRILRECGFPREGQLLVTFHGLHEEGGSAPLLRLIERGIVGDAVLIGELASGQQLITQGGGLTFWDLSFDSGFNPVHETNRPPEAPDLLDAAVTIRDDLLRYGGELEARNGSLFIGSLSVGDYYNRLPVTGKFSGTRRHREPETLAGVERELIERAQELSEQLNIAVDMQADGITEAYSVDSDGDLVQALQQAYTFLHGESMVPLATNSVGNAAHFVHFAGVPAVYHGANYASAHSDVESVSIAELATLAGTYALVTALFLEPDLVNELSSQGK